MIKVKNYCKGTTKAGQDCKLVVRKGNYCRYHYAQEKDNDKNKNNNNKNDNNSELIEDNSEECIICFDKKNNMMKTICGHEFCKDCICKITNDLCPMCRNNIINDINKIKEDKNKEIIIEKEETISDRIEILRQAGITIDEIRFNYAINF